MGTSPSFCPCCCFSKAGTTFCQGQRPASPANTQICRKSRPAASRPFFLCTDPRTRGHRAEATLGPGRFCLRCTFHFYRSLTAAILPHSRCQQWGGGRPSPRLLISQVPLLGMCLSLRVPVAAWKWTEAQRVTKRGSPCAARLPAAPGLRKGYF